MLLEDKVPCVATFSIGRKQGKNILEEEHFPGNVKTLRSHGLFTLTISSEPEMRTLHISPQRETANIGTCNPLLELTQN